MRTSLGGMAKRPIPHELVLRWYGPLLTDAAIRRDLAVFLRGTRKDTFDNPRGLSLTLRRFIAAHPAPVVRGAV